MPRNPEENLFDGIDGAVILRLLPEHIKQAEELLTDTALTLASLRINPHVVREEVELVEKTYLARKFQYDDLKARFARIEAATKKVTEPAEA